IVPGRSPQPRRRRASSDCGIHGKPYGQAPLLWRRRNVMPLVDYVRHHVRCKCGHEGSLIFWDNSEWGTRGEFWDGFTQGRASRDNPPASTAKCAKCGNTEIEIAPAGTAHMPPNVNRT